MVKCLKFKSGNEPRRGNQQNLRPDSKNVRLAWSPHFKIHNLEKFLSIRLRRETQ